MSTTPIDRVRDWIEGRLPAVEVERVEREIAGDPELAAFAAEYRAVHRMTALLDGVAPVGAAAEAGGSAQAADLEGSRELADERSRSRGLSQTAGWRRAAAVLILIGAVAAGALAWRTWRLSLPVRLAAIPLTPDAAAPSEAAGASLGAEDPPDFLADYAPVEERAIRWLSDPAEARRASRATGRPLFVFGFFRTCPWCIEMKAQALQDERVLALVERTLPVGIDLGEADRAFAGVLMERGYPFLAIEREDGSAAYEFHGKHDADGFRAHLEAGLARAELAQPALPWEQIRLRAIVLSGAKAAEREGHFAEAQQGFDELAFAADGSSYEAAGLRGVRRIAAAARDALLAAREIATHDVVAARARLADAASALRGTRYAQDLEKVLARLDDTGRFPELDASRY